MLLKFISIIVSLLVLGLSLELIRRERLTFKYAMGWILVGLGGLFFAIFDKMLFRMAYGLGFELPSNFVFFMLLAFFTFLSLFLTIFLCQQNNRNDIMAQKIGILEFEVDRLMKLIEDDRNAPGKT
jgi:hypothetical protein